MIRSVRLWRHALIAFWRWFRGVDVGDGIASPEGEDGPMTEQEYRECLEAIRQDTERTRTREEARQQLRDEGFITEDGSLSPNYENSHLFPGRS